MQAVAQALGFRFDGLHAPASACNYHGLDYAQFVVPLGRAVQELSAENTALKVRAALEAAVALATEAEAKVTQATAALETCGVRLRRRAGPAVGAW